jgi:predicted RNA-binding Zn ribbon-like protein
MAVNEFSGRAHPGNPFRDLRLVGGVPCLDFTNTVDHRNAADPNERLRSFSDLLWWANRAELLSAADVEELAGRAEAVEGEAATAFARAIALREALYRTFSAVANGTTPSNRDLDLVSAEARSAAAHRKVVREGGRFRWEWTTSRELDHMLRPIALSAADLLTGTDLDRLGHCAGEDCDWLFLDTSRNRSRRWCDMKECGNRAKVRRYHRRHRRRV